MIRGRSRDGWWGAVLDAPDARALAEFYAKLLGWRIAKDEPGSAAVAPPSGVAYLGFQTSPEYVEPVWPPAEGAQQMMAHLDVEVDDLEAAVADALAAGARLAGAPASGERTGDARPRRPPVLPLFERVVDPDHRRWGRS